MKCVQDHIKFTGQGFGTGSGAAGVASVRTHQGAPTHQKQPVPASSTTDQPQDRPKPISKAGGSSGITYLRKGQKSCTVAMRERSENM